MDASPLALATVIGASFSYSFLDLTRKKLMSHLGALPLLVVMALGQLPACALWVALAGGGSFQRAYLLPGALSVLLNVVANVLFLVALRLSPLSATIPLLSLTPAFTTLLAVPILGEVPRPAQWIGVVLVVLGAMALNRRRTDGGGAGALLRGLWTERGALLMVIVALLWSLTPPLDKLAVRAASVPLHATVLNAGVGLSALVVLAAGGRVREISGVRHAPGLTALTLLLALGAIGLQLVAISMVWVGMVETVKRALGSMTALGLGSWFLRETIGWNRILAVLVMSAGVALILLT